MRIDFCSIVMVCAILLSEPYYTTVAHKLLMLAFVSLRLMMMGGGMSLCCFIRILFFNLVQKVTLFDLVPCVLFWRIFHSDRYLSLYVLVCVCARTCVCVCV